MKKLLTLALTGCVVNFGRLHLPASRMLLAWCLDSSNTGQFLRTFCTGAFWDKDECCWFEIRRSNFKVTVGSVMLYFAVVCNIFDDGDDELMMHYVQLVRSEGSLQRQIFEWALWHGAIHINAWASKSHRSFTIATRVSNQGLNFFYRRIVRN